MGVWETIPLRNQGSLGNFKIPGNHCVHAIDSDSAGICRLNLCGISDISDYRDCVVSKANIN